MVTFLCRDAVEIPGKTDPVPDDDGPATADDSTLNDGSVTSDDEPDLNEDVPASNDGIVTSGDDGMVTFSRGSKSIDIVELIMRRGPISVIPILVR